MGNVNKTLFGWHGSTPKIKSTGQIWEEPMMTIVTCTLGLLPLNIVVVTLLIIVIKNACGMPSKKFKAGQLEKSMKFLTWVQTNSKMLLNHGPNLVVTMQLLPDQEVGPKEPRKVVVGLRDFIPTVSFQLRNFFELTTY